MATKRTVADNWRKHLLGYHVSSAALFDSSFLERWGEQVWKPEQADKHAAAELHTQIVSRITTQALGYLEGVEEAALESVFQLFGKARDAADKNYGANHFEVLTWHVLNTFVRPFTSRWHAQKRRGMLSALDTTDEFRTELAVLQSILVVFDDLLIDIRDGQRPPGAPKGVTADTRIATEMGRPLRWGISKTLGGLSQNDAEQINIAEQSAISGRRARYLLPKEKMHATGLALSGGGIRSATFSLGVLIALSRRNLLPQFDYLSTVSGGGYLGSFLTTFLASAVGSGDEKKIGLGTEQLPFHRIDGEAEALRYIRHRSKYLHTSLWERIKFAISQSYGTLVNGFALSLLPVAFALLEYAIRPSIDAAFSPLSPIIWAAVAVVLVSSIMPMLVRVSRIIRNLADAALACVAVVLVSFLFWDLLGFLHQSVRASANRSDVPVLALLGAIPVAASALIGIVGRKFPRVQRALAILAGLSVPFFFLGIDLVTYYVVDGPDIAVPFLSGNVSRWILVLAWVIIFGALVLFALDVNFTSPHRHYRRKLAEAFLIQPAAKPTADRPFDASISLRLSKAAVSNRGPYHLLNCALNVPGSRNPAMQGRLTDLFLFSPAFCGSSLTGFFPTEQWERVDPDLDLGTAMAVSAAAASPLMGLGTVKSLSFWMALLNVRLGYWVRKPYPAPSSILPDAPGISFLLREMVSSIDESKRYINVTDGGHVENLGVYELLRRRCKYIVAIDGEQDSAMTFHALTNLQRLASIDFGITIEVDLDDLRLDEKGLSRSHFRFCRIYYPEGPGEKSGIGYLLYLKLSLTGNEGEFIRRYRLDEPTFPHHSTANQFFTETQFEAYRSLGEHVGDKLFLSALVGALSDQADVPLEEWFRRLGESLLRPA